MGSGGPVLKLAGSARYFTVTYFAAEYDCTQ
jgi:hypothetical protein